MNAKKEDPASRLNRRAALELLGGMGLLALGCGGTALGADSSDGGTSSSSSSGSSGTTTTTDAGSTSTADGAIGNATCTSTPEETAGPYPDKTGMLSNATYKRSDVREGSTGLPVTLVLNVATAGSSCAAVAGATVMIWQCDASGDYSEYSQPGYDGTGKTFLRGYQETDANGQVTFTTVYPGWYAGRATHIHVEVYAGGSVVKTTQIAFDDDVTATVYATGAYAAKGQSPLKNAGDMVFSDGDEYELAALTGDTTNGYTAKLTVGI